MSPQTTTQSAIYEPSQDRPSPNKSAWQRLAEIRLSLQKQLRRKGTGVELTALDHAALMLLRYEMTVLNPASKSDDIVRLHNASRRAVANYERICGIDSTKPKPKAKNALDMRSLEKEIAAHG